MRATKCIIISIIRTTTIHWCRSAAAGRGRGPRVGRRRRLHRPRRRRRRRASAPPRRPRPPRSPARISTATSAPAPLYSRSTSSNLLERSLGPLTCSIFKLNWPRLPLIM